MAIIFWFITLKKNQLSFDYPFGMPTKTSMICANSCYNGIATISWCKKVKTRKRRRKIKRSRRTCKNLVLFLAYRRESRIVAHLTEQNGMPTREEEVVNENRWQNHPTPALQYVIDATKYPELPQILEKNVIVF